MGIVRALMYNASMQWVVVGLGNPDKEYEGTRHNAGKDILASLTPKLSKNARTAEINVYMNNSGGAIRKLVPSQKVARHLIVLHDDLDLPLGSIKISFGSGSGGHRGVESVIKALKTRDFVRVRIGISPATPKGKARRPDPKKITDFVLGKFRTPELAKLKKSKKTVLEALEILMTKGLSAAMNEINSKR